VSHRNNFDARSGFPEDYKVWKPPKHNPARAEYASRILFRVVSNPLDRAVKFIKETFPQPACCVACTGRWLFQLPPKRQGEFERIRWSPVEPSPQATARVIPGDELNGSAVNLLKTVMNLLSPSVLCAIVDCVIKAPDQRVDQRGSCLGRQGQRVSQKFCCIPSHNSILPPLGRMPAFAGNYPP
jgi:hypothetical protein